MSDDQWKEAYQYAQRWAAKNLRHFAKLAKVESSHTQVTAAYLGACEAFSSMCEMLRDVAKGVELDHPPTKRRRAAK